jgi:hypothetical protein
MGLVFVGRDSLGRVKGAFFLTLEVRCEANGLNGKEDSSGRLADSQRRKSSCSNPCVPSHSSASTSESVLSKSLNWRRPRSPDS